MNGLRTLLDAHPCTYFQASFSINLSPLFLRGWQVSGGMASDGVPLSEPIKIKAHTSWKNFISTKKVTIWFSHPLFPLTACWSEKKWVIAIGCLLSSIISCSECFWTDSSKIKRKLTRHFVWTISCATWFWRLWRRYWFVDTEHRCLYGMCWGWPLQVTDPEMLHFWH